MIWFAASRTYLFPQRHRGLSLLCLNTESTTFLAVFTCSLGTPKSIQATFPRAAKNQGAVSPTSGFVFPFGLLFLGPALYHLRNGERNY